MGSLGKEEYRRERLPAAFVFIVICCGLGVIPALRDLAFGRGAEIVLPDIAAAGACLLVALGIWARNNVIRLFLILLLTGCLVSSVLSGVFCVWLMTRGVSLPGSGGVLVVILLISGVLLLPWFYWRLLIGVRSESARRQFAGCGQDPAATAREKKKEWAAICVGALLVGAMFARVLRGLERPEASLTSRSKSVGLPPREREYRFDDFGCRIRLDDNLWKCGSAERDVYGGGKVRSLSFGGVATGSGERSGFVFIAGTGTSFVKGADAMLVDLIEGYEKRSWKIVAKSRSLISGIWVPCVVARNPKQESDDQFRAEWRWHHAGVDITLVVHSGSENLLGERPVQRLLTGIEMVPVSAPTAKEGTGPSG